MCGIAGVRNHPNASAMVAVMLEALQHRGHDGAGIASSDGESIHEKKGLGYVKDVFKYVRFETDLPGSMAIGMNRYATTGDARSVQNIHPFHVWKPLDGGVEKIAVVHNGNIINYESLKAEMIEQGTVFSKTSDTEIVLHLIDRSQENTFGDIIRDACSQLQGAYSLLFLGTKSFFAVTDPHLFRPLVMGRIDEDTYVFASEICAFTALDAAGYGPVGDIVELGGGEMVSFFHSSGILREAQVPPMRSCHCTFEHVYLASQHSTLFGMPISVVQKELGRSLAQQDFDEHGKALVMPDIVIGVPDSGCSIAQWYTAEYVSMFGNTYGRYPNILYVSDAVMRNPAINRTFIAMDQKTREELLKKKFIVNAELINGKSILLIDDSIVRSSTMKILIPQLRKAGAREIHVRSGSPEIIEKCDFGINISNRDELIAAQFSIDEICVMLDIDSLKYNSINALLHAVGDPQNARSCTTCFSGTPPDTDSFALKLKLPMLPPSPA